MANEMLEKIKAYMESEEGKKRTEEYFGRIANREKVNERWLDKFHNMSLEDKNEFISKCEKKYYSEDYIYKWNIKGIMPPVPFLFHLYDYASSNNLPNLEYNEEDYFTTGKYLLTNKWGIRRIDGQGSICEVFPTDDETKVIVSLPLKEYFKL